MTGEATVRAAQEQGVAAWISYLNELRLVSLMQKLTAQNVNLQSALSALQTAKEEIFSTVASNRGGLKGVHGFIAEAAEVGIENARDLIRGDAARAVWVDNNSDADILRDFLKIQMKFCQSGGSYGLDAIKKHFTDYPQYAGEGYAYMIPKDFHDKLSSLWNLSAEEAGKLPKQDFAVWQKAQNFFRETGLPKEKIQPAALEYREVQAATIDQTLNRENRSIRVADEKLRKQAVLESNPGLVEAAQVTAFSAGIEAAVSLLLAMHRKTKEGKTLWDFTEDDWKELGIETAAGGGKGTVRGAAVYTMTNFANVPAPAASALITAIFGVFGQAYQLEQGNIDGDEFLTNSQVVCVDAAVTAVSALIGQTIIPIPVLGAVIGSAAGSILDGIAKDYLGKKEQKLIQSYHVRIEALNDLLEEQYRALVRRLQEEFAKFSTLLDLAFDKNANTAFRGSILLADYVGIPGESVLKSKEDIDNYFL